MLRLTETTRTAAEVVLQAEGQLVAEWVPLLERECRKLLAGDRRLLLDLAHLSYADPQGVRMLRKLAKEPLSIINCTPLVQELLTQEVL